MAITDGKYRCVGFDLGDTLLYYRGTPMSWVELYPDALHRIGVACKVDPTTAQIASAIQTLSRYNTRLVPRQKEVTSDEIFSQILRDWGIESASNLVAATDAFFTFFQQKMSAYPETVSVLIELRKQKLPIGVLTDVPYGMPRSFVQRDLNGAGIAGLIDVLLTSAEVGLRKPDTDGYHALAAKLGCATHEMLFIGNEPKDVIGACRAGAGAVFLDRSSTRADHGQNHTLSSLSGLHDILFGTASPGGDVVFSPHFP